MNSTDILGKLIAFDTTSRDSNLAFINWVRDYLDSLGIASELFFNDARNKANLYARIGPDGPGGIMLSGHSDVVPVDGQPWTVPPFAMTQTDGKLYGRGTADMKGFIACVLAALPQFLAAPLKQPLHIAISYDEEVGCLGVRSLLAALRERLNKPAMCIVGEPTAMQPILGHKGKLAMRCEVHGAPCHSAYAPQGVNAISYAARLIACLDAIGQRLATDTARHDARFDPPYSTVQAGVIQGGQALNIVPEHCRFDFEMRVLPADDPQAVMNELREYAERELLPRMQAVHAGSRIDFSELSRYPGLLTDRQSQAAKLLAQLIGSQNFSTVAFGSEGGLFDEIGIATVVCGPGSMDQGHKPDEYVTLVQLAACEAMLARLTDWMCSDPCTVPHFGRQNAPCSAR